MKEDTLYVIYTAVAAGNIMSRSELIRGTGLSAATVSSSLTILRRAGLIRENLIGKTRCFRPSGALFAVLDASGGDFVAYCYDEALGREEMFRLNKTNGFALHESLRVFVSQSLRTARQRSTVSFCVLAPTGYDVFCSLCVPDYVSVVNLTPETAAERMRKKYFTVRLRFYRERVLQKNIKCDII